MYLCVICGVCTFGGVSVFVMCGVVFGKWYVSVVRCVWCVCV